MKKQMEFKIKKKADITESGKGIRTRLTLVPNNLMYEKEMKIDVNLELAEELDMPIEVDDCINIEFGAKNIQSKIVEKETNK